MANCCCTRSPMAWSCKWLVPILTRPEEASLEGLEVSEEAVVTEEVDTLGEATLLLRMEHLTHLHVAAEVAMATATATREAVMDTLLHILILHQEEAVIHTTMATATVESPTATGTGGTTVLLTRETLTETGRIDMWETVEETVISKPGTRTAVERPHVRKHMSPTGVRNILVGVTRGLLLHRERGPGPGPGPLAVNKST